jgi:hypothetical protein
LKTFKQILESVDRFTKVDLASHTKGMQKYSHGPGHEGHIDKSLKLGISHKKIHAAAKNAGYTYTHKSDTIIGDKPMTYHMYSKTAGPYSDHSLTVTTMKGTDKVWNVEHKTNTDRS